MKYLLIFIGIDMKINVIVIINKAILIINIRKRKQYDDTKL